jgi:hypothetical protein
MAVPSVITSLDTDAQWWERKAEPIWRAIHDSPYGLSPGAVAYSSRTWLAALAALFERDDFGLSPATPLAPGEGTVAAN